MSAAADANNAPLVDKSKQVEEARTRSLVRRASQAHTLKEGLVDLSEESKKAPAKSGGKTKLSGWKVRCATRCKQTNTNCGARTL